MVGFDVIFDIVAKIVLSLVFIAVTLFCVISAIYLIATGAPFWSCFWAVFCSVVFLGHDVALCLSAQKRI